MAFYADLHVHSKYSRATSRNCDLEHLALWARKKGITVVGTGDFTHPAWLAELKDKLIPAEPGLFRLRPDLERAVASRLPRACHGPTRFMLSVEISTIYKKGEATRKIHHLIYAPDFATVEAFNHSLGKIGNLKSDGRPILGLDSRHLLEIALDSGPGAYLVPAHIWTPWFAALGSKSGFDSIDLCYADLAPHIFAVETGLSSDPPMNWRVSSLDRFRLVSNSDAHSPEKLGREACVFTGEPDYFAIRSALETGQGYAGTVEFFPEEGKYHLDGHRACQVRLSPRETRAAGGACSVCGKALTVGVMHRVEALADRMEDTPPLTAGNVQSLVPLPEVLSELHQVGSKSKRVSHHYEQLLGQLGPELPLLTEVPMDDIRRLTSSLFAEAITRLREHRVIRDAGYDGAYGTIRLFQSDELRRHALGRSLFPDVLAPPEAPSVVQEPERQVSAMVQETPAAYPQGSEVVQELDADQRRAVEAGSGPILIVAGPGSGKTRTLTHRIAHLVRQRGVPAARCLAITFTRRAADEMRARLQTLLPAVWKHIPLFTFHALGLAILQEHWNAAGLQRGFRIATAAQRLDVLRKALDVSETQARRLLATISHAKRTQTTPEAAKLAHACETYQRELALRNLVDYDDLVSLAADVLETQPDLQASHRQRYPWVFIDEYQDVDEQQVRLIKQLAPADGNVCAIGDANQAIYGFRGADVRFFERFQDDFPNVQVVRLQRNYRSQPHIVALSTQLMVQSDFQPASVSVHSAAPRRIILHEAASEAAEAEFVVRTVEQLLGGHSFFSIDSGRAAEAATDNLSFADIAVLYRMDAQAPALVEALARSGMPFQHRSHRPLIDHPGVSPLVDALLQRQGTGSLREQLAEAATPYEHDEAETVAAAADRLEALDLLQPLATACGNDLERFLAELALGTQVDTWDPRADRISLLTLHAAKGLEFPVVFIVGCEDGLLPLVWGQISQADLNEERRLFYVGMTRAKTRLYLCHARQRLWRGRVQTLAPSPFLDNLEEGFLDRQRFRPQSARSRKPDAQLRLF